MLDIKFVRENTETVRKDLEKRRDEEKIRLLEAVLAKDDEWRELKSKTDALRGERNRISQEINETKKAGGDIQPLLEKAKEIPSRLKDLDEKQGELAQGIRDILMRLPNIMHESVPYGDDESGNEVVAVFGEKMQSGFRMRNHTELIEALGIVDLERAAKIAGSRFYLLIGDLARLELALTKYAVDFMSERGYALIQPPHMMNRAAYEGVTDLADFEEMIYKVQGEDLHLIATSEHPLTAQFKDEVLNHDSLPIRLVGMSPCYRKEAGTHGKEEKGIWRVHQFNKVEQIIVCRPEESWQFHDELLKNAIDFFTSLELHFRQVLICSGDLGIVAAKKYDLEAWIPSIEEFKEVVSCSNCTSYQAVRLNIRYSDGKTHEWVHTLNSTCVATSRALVAILEQFQNEDGSVTIPPVLRQYMGGQERIAPAR